MSVYDKVARQRRFYETGASRSLSVRRKALKRLEVAIRCNEKWIRQALWADLNKSDTEAYMMEIGQVLSEISYAPVSYTHLEHEIGMLEAGRKADMIVVEGNAAEDIFALNRLKHVYRDGVEV